MNSRDKFNNGFRIGTSSKMPAGTIKIVIENMLLLPFVETAFLWVVGRAIFLVTDYPFLVKNKSQELKLLY